MACAFQTIGTVLDLGTRVNSTVPAPASIVDGDGLIIVGYWETTPTPPTGFVACHANIAPLAFPTHTQAKGYAFKKIASGESGNYVVTHASSPTEAVCIRINGQDPAFALDPAAPGTVADVDVSTPSNISAPAITTVIDGAYVLAVYFSWDRWPTTTPVGGWTERVDRNAAVNTIMYVMDKIQTTAGTTGAAALSGPVGNNDGCAFQVGFAAARAPAAEQLFVRQAVRRAAVR